jgi:hypothetical protein
MTVWLTHFWPEQQLAGIQSKEGLLEFPILQDPSSEARSSFGGMGFVVIFITMNPSILTTESKILEKDCESIFFSDKTYFIHKCLS